MTATVRRDLPEAPARIARLPVDPDRGYPVPWFVHWDENGKPDFRVIKQGRIRDAIKYKRCWICGDPLGTFVAYVAGPMCAINRVSSEPPSHRECAVYAAQACPFLVRPHMHRREAGLPDEAVEPAGDMIKRNPGVALVWVTRKSHVFRVPASRGGGILFDIGTPTEALWFAHGRPATRAEVDESIRSGLPELYKRARPAGQTGVEKLERAIAAMQEYLP